MTTAHKIEIVSSDEHVLVELDGDVLAETDRPVVLREGKLRPRYYLRREDVRMEKLAHSATTSHCPFKGDATYWSLIGGPSDIAWTYEQPIAGAEEIAGLICFYNEKVTLEIT
jgi:uncharacterized protein (DUF427 family)